MKSINKSVEKGFKRQLKNSGGQAILEALVAMTFLGATVYFGLTIVTKGAAFLWAQRVAREGSLCLSQPGSPSQLTDFNCRRRIRKTLSPLFLDEAAIKTERFGTAALSHGHHPVALQLILPSGYAAGLTIESRFYPPARSERGSQQ